MTHISIIIPAYKRVEQTIHTISLILDSAHNDFSFEVLVLDGSADTKLFAAISKQFGERIKYIPFPNSGIAMVKNRGAKEAKGEVIIFCDSDIEVENDTLSKSVTFLKEHSSVAGVGGQVLWRGGSLDGQQDRPRREDRRKIAGETEYVEAVYSRYFATYKKVFWNVGGYDEKVFNMRGEGSDLSIRYWRAGYPLAFDQSIKTYHVHDAPDSATRVTHPEWGIAKDLLLLAYKYDMVDGEYENFAKTVAANFEQYGKNSYNSILQGIASNLAFIAKSKEIIDQEKAEDKPCFNFKFLEVFSDNALFLDCIQDALRKLKEVREKVFHE